jgi:phosphoserine phosphatase
MAHDCTAVFSSDWSECLSPSGPFDFIAWNFPQLRASLDEVFRAYTGNRISLGAACDRVRQSLPEPVTAEMMDAYLDREFAVYRGVPELIEWCRGQGVLFMLNTTGMIGYFQRVFAKGLLPRVPVISANPLVRYAGGPADPGTILELAETADKGKNTAALAAAEGIPAGRVVVMGDSGGDGPHFEWAHRAGAIAVGSMTKASLDGWCRERGIPIRVRFGRGYGPGETRSLSEEMAVDFRGLIPIIAEILAPPAGR